MPEQLIKVYITVLVYLLFFFAGCKDELVIPPVYHQTVFLDTILVEPTEIDLHLTTSDSVHTPSTLFQVRRDSVIIFSKFVLQKDTVIVDTGLRPSHVYKYKALRLKNSVRTDSSKLMSLRTMDTTSHNFVWEVDTIGDGNNSVLFDVAIINDTLAYAVGAIYKKDSSGQFGPLNNLAQLNGHTLQLFRVSVKLTYPTSSIITDQDPLKTVFAFNTNDIWFVSSAGGVTRYLNGQWIMIDIPYMSGPGGANKMWGTSSDNMYFVANGGQIVHYDGTTWQKMDSGTDVDLTDVWGSPDGSIVWACGYYYSKRGTYLVGSISGQPFQIIYDGSFGETSIRSDSLSGAYSTLYTPSSNQIFIASDAGLYKALSSTRGEAKRLSFTTTNFPGLPTRLRGNGSNDMTIVGAYDFVAHYNGSTWRYFSELSRPDQGFRSAAQRGNLIVAVGDSYDPINSRGIVLIGRR